jgi:hypothetical protein
VRVEIAESTVTPQLWTMLIVNQTTGGSFTLTLPYTSTYGTAEWVIETPIVISDDGGITVGPMPDLGVVRFDNATANGLPAGFVAAEQMQLVDFDLSLIAKPSLPDRDADGFNDCTYRVSCPMPHKELRLRRTATARGTVPACSPRSTSTATWARARGRTRCSCRSLARRT